MQRNHGQVKAKATSQTMYLKNYAISQLFSVKTELGETLYGPESIDLLHKTARRQFQTFLQEGLKSYCHNASSAHKAKQDEQLKIFISYAWADDKLDTYPRDKANQVYVEKIAKDLTRAGFDVLLDRWEDSVLKESTVFIEKMLTEADYILILGSPLYLQKYNHRSNNKNSPDKVVRYEATILHYLDLYNDETRGEIVTALLQGDKKEQCLPPLLTRKNPLLFDTNNYFENMFKLIRDLYKISPDNKDYENLVKEFRGLLSAIEEINSKELQEEYNKSNNERINERTSTNKDSAVLAIEAEIKRASLKTEGRKKDSETQKEHKNKQEENNYIHNNFPRNYSYGLFASDSARVVMNNCEASGNDIGVHIGENNSAELNSCKANNNRNIGFDLSKNK